MDKCIQGSGDDTEKSSQHIDPQNSNEMVPTLALQSLPSQFIPFTIQNMVASADLGVKVDLQRTCVMTKNSEYRPRKFSALIFRLSSPVCSALLFSSGKVIVSGCRSLAEANLAARKVARVIQKIGYESRFRDFKVCNMVALVDVKFPINLDELNNSHGQFCRYEPEIFPGIFYQMLIPRVKLLIFVSGKFLIIGAKDEDQIRSALDSIYPILYTFRKARCGALTS